MTKPSLDDLHELTAEARTWLVSLHLGGSIAWSYKRPMPEALGVLVSRGLAYRSHFTISLTEKGCEVLDRVA